FATGDAHNGSGMARFTQTHQAGTKHIATPKRDIVRWFVAVFLSWRFDEWAKGKEAALRKVAYVGVPHGQSLQTTDRKLVRHYPSGQKAAFRRLQYFGTRQRPQPAAL